MKKVIQVNKSQLQKLIQEEAKKQKRILDLKNKREEIVITLNEMYENDDQVEEGWFGDLFHGSHDEWKKKYIEYVQKMQAIHGEDTIPMPEGQDLEDAVAAARKSNDVRVVKRGGKWVPISNVTGNAGSAFGQ